MAVSRRMNIFGRIPAIMQLRKQQTISQCGLEIELAVHMFLEMD
jgi:hypothetical protein